MKLKLIDIQQEPHKVELGTCERCMSTDYMVEPVFTFKSESGRQFDVDGYFWNWGDLFTVGMIDNVIDFADFVRRAEFDEIPEEQWTFNDDYNWLDNLIESYYDYKEKLEGDNK